MKIKNISVVSIFVFFASKIFAQVTDVTILSQNAALADSNRSKTIYAEQIAPYPYISETYEIPAYYLYQQHWDTSNIRSQIITIPFSNDRLMLMLVQDANNPFEMPCRFEKIRSTYGTTKKGDFHTGIDLVTSQQTLVKSCFDGVVRMAKDYGDYGFTVVVRHYNGLETVYSHLDKIYVKPYQTVKSGQVLGQAGTSGNTKDCILHFETRFLNEHFDPELIIDFEEEDILQNNIALMSKDFTIIPTDSLDKTQISKAKPTISETTNTKKDELKEQKNSDLQPSTENAKPEVKPKDTPTQNAVYHTVAAGENLYRISLKYNTTVEEIMRLNNFKNADKIIEGQRIRVR